jgi:hypothetical protein
LSKGIDKKPFPAFRRHALPIAVELG